MLVPLLILLGIVAYLYKKWSYSYWKRKNLYYIEPESFYGNIKDLMVGKISLTDQYKSLYDEFKSKGLRHGGFYEMFAPAYMPIDIEITKNILQKDFANFRNHGEYTNEKIDPLSGHLLNLEDDKWKNLRAKLTPTFTSGKMKMMFPTMVSCSSGLKDLLKESADLQDVVDIKEIISRFTTDVIGSAAFGLDCNSLKNPNSEFRTFGRNVFKGSTWRRIKRTLVNTLPVGLVTFFRVKRTPKEIEEFFMGVVNSTVKYREENKVFRKDFMHLLLQLKNKGYTTDDEDFLPAPDKTSKDGQFLTLNEVAAQCFVFFLAGFETSATTMTFALLELAQNPDVQETLRKDINTVLKKHNNEMTYEAIMSMNYLDKVVNETLRKHPAASLTGRVCNTAYKVPGSDVIIEPGVKIRIPIQGIHRDPEYYPDPEKFDPERFSEENKATRPNCTFMPFGEGPRMCIGARFGLLQVKVGLATIIGNFSVTLNDKTLIPIKYDPKAVISGVKGDVWLNVRSIH